jgi:hypothetical protein
MQTKTGAFLSMGRIPQFIGHAAVAAGLLAGGASLLNAGGAMATPTCPGSDSVLNASGIGTFNLSAMVETPALPSLTVCDLTSGIPNRVAYDVDLPGPGALGPLSGSYTYTLQATPGEFFYDARVDSDVNDPGNVTVRKQVYSDSGFTSLIWDQTSVDGSAIGFIPFNGGSQYATIYVRDTYNVPSGTSLNVATNVYNQTPGPLPILGAGAAFGFSRKLRSRIKAARLS